MTNPFKYGKEVTGYQFYDRVRAADELYRHLRDGTTNVVISAPRRYGKTSLVMKVLERFRQEGTRCLHFDVSKVGSVERFCEEYAAAVSALFGGLPDVMRRISDALVPLHPTFSLSPKGVAVRFDYGDRMTASSVSEVLELPERLAASADAATVVVAFDEFQEVAGLSRDVPLEAVFRGVIQSHTRVRYAFLGSKTHLMKRMFGLSSRPFYRSALTLKVGKPPEDESAEFVSSRFASEGIAIPVELTEEIVRVSENIPYYLQAVAGLAFFSVERRNGREVERGDIDFAVTRLLENGEDLYAEILSKLSSCQRALLEALAAEPAAKFDDSYRSRHALGNVSTLHSSRRGLIEQGLVEQEDGRYKVGDPFFARYIQTASAARVLL